MKTQQDLQDSLIQFARTSADIAGVDATVQMLDNFTLIIKSDPGTYRKLSDPENVKKITSMLERFTRQGKKPGPLEFAAIYGNIVKILK